MLWKIKYMQTPNIPRRPKRTPTIQDHDKHTKCRVGVKVCLDDLELKVQQPLGNYLGWLQA